VVVEIMTAVTTSAEQSGAQLLAEGSETAQHEQMARSLGAALGRGWRYGRRSPLPAGIDALPAAQRPLLRPADGRPVSRSPYAAAARLRTSQWGPRVCRSRLASCWKRQAGELHGLAVVLAAFEPAQFFTPPQPGATALSRTRQRSSSRSAPAGQPNRCRGSWGQPARQGHLLRGGESRT